MGAPFLPDLHGLEGMGRGDRTACSYAARDEGSFGALLA